MEKEITFFKGDPAEAKLFGNPAKAQGPRMVSTEREEAWLKRRNEARKNPPSFAIVQNPLVYK